MGTRIAVLFLILTPVSSSPVRYGTRECVSQSVSQSVRRILFELYSTVLVTLGEGGIGDFRVACVKGCLVECEQVWCARTYCFVQ